MRFILAKGEFTDDKSYGFFLKLSGNPKKQIYELISKLWATVASLHLQVEKIISFHKHTARSISWINNFYAGQFVPRWWELKKNF